MWNLGDNKLLEINGVDYTLYLLMLRYFALFYVCVTAFNACVMMPIYLTGHPFTSNNTTQKLNTTMDEITVINVAAVDWKVNFSYFVSIMIVSSLFVVMIQKLRLKYESWKNLRSPSKTFKTDADVAHYSIMIQNLPTNKPPELL